MSQTTYYVWSEGQETGPMEHADVIRRWVGGELPKGFLWRRSDQSNYRPPGELYEERVRDYAEPSRIEPAAPVRASRRTSSGIQWFASLSCVLGVFALIIAAMGHTGQTEPANLASILDRVNGQGPIAHIGTMTNRIVWAVIGLALVVIGVGASIRASIQELIKNGTPE